MADPKIQQICTGLSRYYQSLDKEYDALFSIYCEDNGIDDESLEDELQQEAEDCLLIDFDDNFPFQHEAKDKIQFIFDLINKCAVNPNPIFYIKVPWFDVDFFVIKYAMFTKTKEIYQKQCPYLCESGIFNNADIHYMLAIGYKNKFEYFLNLVDDYYRDIIKNIATTWTVSQWNHHENHKHFKLLRNITVSIPKEEKKNDKSHKVERQHFNNLASSAINTYLMHYSPKLMMNGIAKIDDSIEITIKYIDAAIGFISDIIKNADNKKQELFPFQMDFCIGYGSVTDTETVQRMYARNEYDEDEDDEDEDDMDDDKIDDSFYDIIGDIKAKLKGNNLVYESTKNKPLLAPIRFTDLFQRFEKQLLLQDDEKTDDESAECHKLHSKRFIMFVDRRAAPVEITKTLKAQTVSNTSRSQRDKWMNGSECEIYSESKKRWFEGKIVNIFSDDEGEWLKVQYRADNILKKKEIQRYNQHIRGKKQSKNERNTKEEDVVYDEKCDIDDIYMYYPPKNCRDIASNYVYEWFINASKTCLLPNVDYDDNECMQHRHFKSDEERHAWFSQKNEDKYKRSNIGASFHCKGQLLTLSFIIKEVNRIKCYLYWNGQMIRFMPTDVKSVLPKIFNMKWNDGVSLKTDGDRYYVKYFEKSKNELFMESMENDELIQKMSRILKDEYFKAFQESYQYM